MGFVKQPRGSGEAGRVDVNSENWYNESLLFLAAWDGHEVIVQLLLETGRVDVDSKVLDDSRVPLSLAALKGREAVVKMLLETGRVDVDFKDCDGGTTLSLAAGNGHEVVVKLLLETGKVDAVEERETHNNITALHDDSSLKNWLEPVHQAAVCHLKR